MTGPEHYREAERLVGTRPQANSAIIAIAQVHATLAHAAAIALGSRERDHEHDPDGMDPADRLAWEAAASEGRKV